MFLGPNRLSLIARIQAIEFDLNNLIANEIINIENKVLNEKQRNDARLILEKDNQYYSYDLDDEKDLLLGLDFGSKINLINKNKHKFTNSILFDEFKSTSMIIETLTPIRNTLSHTRPINWDHQERVIDGCRQLLINSSNIYVELKKTDHLISESQQ